MLWIRARTVSVSYMVSEIKILLQLKKNYVTNVLSKQFIQKI